MATTRGCSTAGASCSALVTLEAEQAVVPAPFMRTHRSFLVNLDHVSCSSDRVRDRAVAAATFLR
jgi:hypothetical protein